MRYLLLFVMATLTAVGQSTKPAPGPPLCLMKKGDYYVACPKPQTVHPINDGVAAWEAPKQPPEAIKNGTICDQLPETQKITCLMNLIAPEKAAEPDPIKTAQDGYDCTMSRTPKTVTINCTLKEK